MRRDAPDMPSDEEIRTALGAMPEPFSNRQFREALGLYPFPASEILSRLKAEGRIHHFRGNIFAWAVTRS